MELLDPHSSGGGNTSTPPVKQISPAKDWFITWNNYPENWFEILEIHSSKIRAYIYGKEVGESGTPHIQGHLSFLSKVRPKGMFPKEIHWEKSRAPKAAVEYCKKDGDYKIKGYPVPYKEYIEKMYDWEEEIIEILSKKPDKRTIHWRWSRKGCVGKTTFCKYLFTHYSKVVVLSGKKDDMTNGVVQYSAANQGALPEIIVIDIPKSEGNKVCWAGVEAVKSMFFFSPKYESSMVCGPPPHVVCFANREPNLEGLMADRWDIKEIGETDA